SEGDPQIKGKLRQLRAQRARQRMMQAVPTADVVITNPTHFAVALKYDPDKMDAPVCVAKGADEVAFRIRELARDSDVVIYESPPLA
ncbi:EscU/YscU/HrcU family type III secretion system export apparatus switch protein, partial [Metapseudomonas otitidis]|uniref:EscU/YscU/HrcU family type III secretion system export apparatus switch protein n=1 Tax=Metapseudomonas otitidis TaxID=319939 RepID=UPI00366CB25F